MFLRKYSGLLLAAAVLALAGGAFYFLKINPLWDKVRKGLDIRGGIHVVYEGVDAPEMPVTREAMEQARRIMEQRVNALGVAEPVLQLQGAGQRPRIVVELPDIRDPDKALEVLGRTAILEFKDHAGNVIVSGKDLDPRAIGVALDQAGGAVVTLRFKGEAARRFAAATEEAVRWPTDDPRRRIGIFLDGEQIQNPVVQDAILTGQAQITGYPSVEDARRIAVALQSGALPVKLRIVENRTISPTLGSDSIQKGQAAALIGVTAVAAFMFLIYRIPGFWADAALALYLLLMLGALVALRATLTLPGLAGFVLSVGMAVDANVIIFERIKEELRQGKTVRAALDAGFRNAMRAIVDSNLTTVIGAIILYALATGPVRGFAVTLMLGIALSMFTAVTVTRQFLKLLVEAGMRPGRLFFTPVPAPPAGAAAQRGGVR